MASKHMNCHQNSQGVEPIFYCITFLLGLDRCWPQTTKQQSTILTLLPGDNLSFLDVLPNYSRQNQRSRGALYFFMMFFSAGMWSASTCSFVFHECMKSDLLRQLSCHLRSPFIRLLLAFAYAFTRIAHRTTV